MGNSCSNIAQSLETTRSENPIEQQPNMAAERETLNPNNDEDQTYNEIIKCYETLQQLHCRYREEKEVEISKRDQEIKKLRQKINYRSDMEQRADQSMVEDVTSANKQSDVEIEFESKIRNNARQKALRALGKAESQIHVQLNKELTCRIFVVAYEKAKVVAGDFFKVLPTILRCGPQIGIASSQGIRKQEDPQDEPILPLKIGNVNPNEISSSVRSSLAYCVKEIAKKCDIKSLKEVVIEDLRRKRDKWRKEDPHKVHLTDQMIEALDEYITTCTKFAWSMVTLTPPLEIGTSVSMETFEYEHLSAVEQGPNQNNKILCIWPALFDGNGKLIRKGDAVVLPATGYH